MMRKKSVLNEIMTPSNCYDKLKPLLNKEEHMTSSTTLKKAYSEVDECLEILGTEYKKQIPIKLRDYIKKEKDTNYK